MSTSSAPAPTTRAEVLLRAKGKKAGKLVYTFTAASTTVTGKGLKARNGSYKLRVCAGSKCVTRKVKVAKGKIKLTKLTLPAKTGALKVTLRPARGTALSGRLAL